MAVIYLVDSSVYLEPTYAEAVTNFLRFAREEKLTANLLIADAGYLPLLPRLITLLCEAAAGAGCCRALFYAGDGLSSVQHGVGVFCLAAI